MTAAIWKKVDRFELLKALRLVAGQRFGELLIVVGDDDSERSIAADLAKDFYGDLGLEVVRIFETAGKASLVRQLLATAWRQVDQPSGPDEIPRSVSHARYLSAPQLIGEIAACREASGQRRTAFIFDTVDPIDRMPRAQMSYFMVLAQETDSPVVVFSRAESRSQFPAGTSILAIGGLPVSEIRTSLLTSRDFANIDSRDVGDLLEAVTALHDGGQVPAAEAYDVLQAALRRLGRS